MRVKRNKCKLTVLAIILLLLIITVISGWLKLPAYAETYVNTDVLEDLKKDEKFDVKDYPARMGDYSISVIQIAEGERGSVYLYTYQPCLKTKDLTVTDINMSLSEEVTGTKLYSLTRINTNGVFGKYLIDGIRVGEGAERYYNISAVYRAYDKMIDSDAGDDNTTEKKSYSVGKLFKVTTENGGIKYEQSATYTVQIIDPYVDYLIYTTKEASPNISEIRFAFDRWAMIDSHYIAFSTDLKIDRLMSADVSYMYRSGEGQYNTFLGFNFGGDVTYGTPTAGAVTLNYTDRVEKTGETKWGKKYSYAWNRIQTVAEFISSEDSLRNETVNRISGNEWVLRFTETERTQTDTGILGYKNYSSKFTKVDLVTVLRLEFETDGVVYNLGAVSDVRSGDDHAGNVEPKPIKTFGEWLEDLIKKMPWWGWAIVAVVILAILLPVLSLVFPVIGQVIKLVFKGIVLLIKGLVWIICLPFKGIGWLINKISNKDKDNADKKRKRKTEKTDG